MKPLRTIAAMSTLLALAACGGGGDTAVGPVVTPAGVPDSALRSAAAFSAWVGSLRADDHAEPLPLHDVQPPLSETDEPLADG